MPALDPTAMPLPTDVRVLRALRRIIRAVDMHSKLLQQSQDITAPQLVCLLAVVRQGPLTIKALSQAIDLSPSTTVGIVDRLAAKGLAARNRSASDRRQVLVSATAAGQELARQAPSPLQDRLVQRLGAITTGEQRVLARSLERLVELMGAADIDASAILDLAPIGEAAAAPDDGADTPSLPTGDAGDSAGQAATPSTAAAARPSDSPGAGGHSPTGTAAAGQPAPGSAAPSRPPLTRQSVVGAWQPPARKP